MGGIISSRNSRGDGEKQAVQPDEPATITETPLHLVENQEVADDKSESRSIGHQKHIFSTKLLLVAFPALSVALFVSFLDQTSVSTAIPAISDDLRTGPATSWIGSSFLIAATAFQLVNGRLSDIFGRKNLLLLCLGLLAGGDLACGFAKTKEQLFAFRSIAGIGGGGVNSIVMIIVSDITTLQNRGRFQGILGAIIAAANGAGPFIGGAVVDRSTWRWVFWLVPITALPAAIAIWVFLPLKHEPGNHIEKMKMIDYGGILLNLAGCLLILVPLSGGGTTYAWNSPLVIAMLTVGGVIWVLFMLYEWKLAPIPIMPLRLFSAPHCPALYAQSFLTGTCFYGNFFYLKLISEVPIYFQSELGYNALVSGALILPVIITTSVASIAGGQFMARVGRYMPLVVAGFCTWTLATGLRCMFSRKTGLGEIIGVLLVEGIGIGFTLQPTLIGLLANSRDEDRAVLTGLRNFLRTIGGAFGITISGTILSNTLGKRLLSLDFVDEDLITNLTSSLRSIDGLGLTSEQKNIILTAYMEGLHYIFIFYAVNAGSACLLTFWVGNTDLKSKSAPKDEEQSDSSTGEPESGSVETQACIPDEKVPSKIENRAV